MNIGQQIAKYRKEKRLTQEQLGEAVGVTSRTVSKWETGLSLPDVDLIPSIASALGITERKAKKTSPKLSERQSPTHSGRYYPICLKKTWTN